MKKKISVHDLQQGMYVSEMVGREWRETPFLFQGFEIHSDDQIQELQQYCQEVYIDTEQGYDIRSKVRPMAATIITKSSLQTKPRSPEIATAKVIDIKEIVKKFSPGHRHVPRYQDLTVLEEEIGYAKEAVAHTRETVYDIMSDVRLGRSVNTSVAKKVVADMVDSVIRNPDALMCLNQLRNKDEYTALHSLRVCVLALAFGRHLDLTPEELNVLGIGALLHDIGKMKVPNEILNKPEKLTDKEFELMKSHVPCGVAILENTHGIPDTAIDVARFHHERYAGSGYAMGMKGEDIGLFGSIGAIVDCYDAITSDRSYHTAISAHEALNKMYSWRGKDFQPVMIEQFIQCMGIYPIGSVVELNNGSVGVVISINRKRRLKPKVALVLKPDKTPLPAAKVIDLMTHPDIRNRDMEIRRVLSPADFKINPTDYIPLGA
jgi:putative nucleotidyltransferase with HDIG domain